MAKLQLIILGCVFVAAIAKANESPFGAPPTTTTTTTTTTTIPTTHPTESSTIVPILPVASNLTQNQNSSQVGHEQGIVSDNLNKTSVAADKHVGHSNGQTITVTSSIILIAIAPILFA